MNFYDLIPGSIGKIFYKINVISKMTDEQKQDYVSRASNERMRAFLNNFTYGMLSDENIDPAQAYQKARMDSWGDLEDGNFGTEVKAMFIQIGQQESFDAILNMESKEDFVGWSNPHFVNMIKEQFKKQNNEE